MSTYFIAFDSTYGAMAAFNELEKHGITYRTVPVPAVISAGCGLAARLDTDDPMPAFTIAKAAGAIYEKATLYEQIDRNEFRYVKD